MFNKYLNDFDKAFAESRDFSKKQENTAFENVASDEPKAKKQGLFGSGIKLPELNEDTVLMLVLVYFLVSDDKQNDGEKSKGISDTLLIIGALLLLGF